MDAPETEIEMNAPEIKVDASKPEMEIDVSEAEIEKDMSEAEIEKDMSEAEIEKDMSEAEKEKDISEAEKEKDISEAEIEKDVSKEKIEMDVSDLSISEWDIVSSSSLENKEDLKDKEEESEDGMVIFSTENATEVEATKGSSVEDIIPEYEYPSHSESSYSSSDIDIIDENCLDESNISVPTIGLSLSSSFGSNFSAPLPTLPESEQAQEPVADATRQRVWHLGDAYMKDILAVFIIGCILAMVMHVPGPPVGAFEEMEKRIMILQEENKELKNHMLSKIEDDKVFGALEEQILALKVENSKLSTFMQDLIHQLEDQAIIFKKESEIKGKESHKNEIDKLKEQVNLLQIDNEELQKQLVRMRYGIYSPRTQDVETSDASLKKESEDNTGKSKNENSTEMLSEEIKELRKKLYSEVEKLKNWKESVQHLMKELENRPKGFENKDQEHASKESDGTKSTAGEITFTSKKDNRENRYEGILKDLNGHLNKAMNNIPQLNISELVNKYMGVNKKNVKGVFEAVGHYFKKAQERTKDIFDDNMKDEMWNFIGGLRKQWNMLRKAYFPKYHKKGRSPGDDADYEPHFAEKHGEKHHQSETSPKKNYRPQNNPQMAKEKIISNIPPPVEDVHESEPNEETQDNLKFQAYKQQLENTAQTIASMNSWVFERAAHRSELRENEEDVNWFLKNRKPAEDSESDSLKEEDPADDPYENLDLFSLD